MTDATAGMGRCDPWTRGPHGQEMVGTGWQAI
jgi:hypothetical protein